MSNCFFYITRKLRKSFTWQEDFFCLDCKVVKHEILESEIGNGNFITFENLGASEFSVLVLTIQYFSEVKQR